MKKYKLEHNKKDWQIPWQIVLYEEGHEPLFIAGFASRESAIEYGKITKKNLQKPVDKV